jgi:hypothetical protein
MKRYRVLSFDLDSRVHLLTMPIRDEWEEKSKKQHRDNREGVEKSLIESYGAHAYKAKRQNFVDLGSKPPSILAFHNRFYEQIREAFVVGAYYPALTAACALGERMLNHLLLSLREDYSNTPEYGAIYRKESFDNWDVPISTLESWDVLLPHVAKQFRLLKDMRVKAIHFRPEVDSNVRELALEAILCLQDIIAGQFSAFGPQPWFITSIPGEIYIKKDWENRPFIRRVYLPNCVLVGPKHRIEAIIPRVVVNDGLPYDDRQITDEEFSDLRRNLKTEK